MSIVLSISLGIYCQLQTQPLVVSFKTNYDWDTSMKVLEIDLVVNSTENHNNIVAEK